ncbi:hypothetical protein ACKVWH_011512, partial [Pyricularia oryzae]
PGDVAIVGKTAIASPTQETVGDKRYGMFYATRDALAKGGSARTVGIWIRKFRSSRYSVIVYSQQYEWWDFNVVMGGGIFYNTNVSSV